MRKAALPAHRDQPAGQAAVIHVPGEVPVDPPQPAGVQAYLGRIDLRLESAHATAFPGRAAAPRTAAPAVIGTDSARCACTRSRRGPWLLAIGRRGLSVRRGRPRSAAASALARWPRWWRR